MKNKKITVLGGAGHIGLPLSIVFANKGFDVSVLDNNLETLRLAKNESCHLKRKMVLKI